ncbi:collagen alpha-1(III) chain-like [Uranotaenia lowii]|uniref:collagen alpha-1(III) chain-like n=1 Tax=Uranotaenia lowii TaxID=190385 RepID=UPI00247A13E3|nr:collagen alpha-1(III) chain-like [Uranotaenia lowii]
MTNGNLSGMYCDYFLPSEQQQQQQHYHPSAGGRGMPKKSEPGEFSGPGSRSKKMNKLDAGGGPGQQHQQGGPGADSDLMSSFGLKDDGSQIMKGGPGNGSGMNKNADPCSINSSVANSGPGIDTMSKVGPGMGMDGHPDVGKMNQGLPGMMSNKPSNKLEYTQQQSQIFVFSTALANKGAEAVMSGQFNSIIAYHCAQMQKQNRLGPCGPEDGVSGAMSPWMDHGHGSPDHHMRMNPGPGPGMPPDGVKKSATIHHTPNSCLENDNSVPMFPNDHHMRMGPGGPEGGPMGGKKPATIHHTPNPCMDQDGSLPMYPNDGHHMRMPGPDGMSKPSTIHHTPNSCMDGPDPNENHPGGPGGHPPVIKMENPSPGGPGGPGPGPGPGSGGGGHSSSTIIDQMNSLVASLPLMKGGNVLSQSRGQPQPSLQGVKVPDENLTPQQRQHREQQLATIRQMQKMFFPEQRAMMDPHGMGMRAPFRGGMGGPDFGGGPMNRPLNPAFMNTPLGANGPMGPDGPGLGPGMINEQIPPMQYNKPGMMNPGMYMGGPGGGPMGPMGGPMGPGGGPMGPGMGPMGPGGPGGPMNRMYKPDPDPIFPPMGEMGGGYNMSNHGGSGPGPGMFNPNMQRMGMAGGPGPGGPGGPNMMAKMPDQGGPLPQSPLVDDVDPLKAGPHQMMLPNAPPQQSVTPGANGPGSNGTANSQNPQNPSNNGKSKEQSVSPEHHMQQQQQGGPGSQQGPPTPQTPQGGLPTPGGAGGPLTPQTSMAST